MAKVGLRALVALVVATGFIDTHAASPSGVARTCAAAPPVTAPAGLPWPVALQTSCGRFVVNSDGAVAMHPRTSPVPAGTTVWWPGDDRWVKFADGHLVAGRADVTLWRSHGTFRSHYDVQLALTNDRLAFSYGLRGAMYVARLDGAERRVGEGETPISWTGGRLVTLSWRGGQLFSRASEGNDRRLLAGHVSTLAPSEEGLVYFFARGRLMVTEGQRPASLARLAALGFTGAPTLEPVGSLLALHDWRHLVILRADGSHYASTLLPGRRKRADLISSAVTANGFGDAVAYTVTTRTPRLAETTYLLRPGGSAATPVYTQRVDYFKVCERMADLSWHGDWLLYSSSEGNVVAFDTRGKALPVELSTFAQGLPEAADEEGFNIDAAWMPS
jgi:hypothetical protein